MIVYTNKRSSYRDSIAIGHDWTNCFNDPTDDPLFARFPGRFARIPGRFARIPGRFARIPGQFQDFWVAVFFQDTWRNSRTFPGHFPDRANHALFVRCRLEVTSS